jgi:hypothetical protein
MIRERSAGPRMFSTFEHKSLVVRGSVCLCFVHSLPQTLIYKEGTCFEGPHVSTFGS